MVPFFMKGIKVKTLNSKVSDEQIFSVENNKLITLFRGCLYNYWKPEEIEGYFG